jgi:alpha-mannosidase
MALCTVTFRWERLPEQIGSQCLHEHCYQYSLYPHSGNWEKGNVFRQTSSHNLPLQIAQCGGKHEGTLSKEFGFFSISPANIVFSGIKKAERRNAFIIRLFNPTEKTLKAKINCAFDIKRARTVTLEEKPLDNLNVSNSKNVTLNIPMKKIVSLEISFNTKRKK